MESSLSWIDHDPKARERTLRIFSFFQERESRDEMGIGSVRDSFADQLFPGTSTLQTRLRYMLFVPWIYLKLENERVPRENFATRAENLERDLIQPLLDSDDQSGVFGRTSGRGIKRLPSSVYWAGLGRWGIFLAPYSQNEYHGRIEEIYRKRDDAASRKKEMAALGDDFEMDFRIVSWHPQIPSPPNGFPKDADLDLTRAEAEFIQDRIQSICGGSLLAFLSQNCAPSDTTEAPWEHPNYNNFSDAHKELLHHARLFSETMHAAALNYNVQLAELRHNNVLVSEHKARFDSWLRNFPLEEVKFWKVDRLWELTEGHGYKITSRTRRFVQSWIELVRESPEKLLGDRSARDLIGDREKSLKGPHSRFANRRALEQWSGYSGISRLVYRWPNVKVLLNDLHQNMVKR